MHLQALFDPAQLVAALSSRTFPVCIHRAARLVL
jgi:hypothetical protein